MNEVQKSEALFTKVTRGQALIEQQTGKRVSANAPKLDYSQDEMLTQLQFDTPLLIEKKEKLDNERVLIKQLLANIEKNRVKWRKDVFESDTLSISRKVAIQGVKDRIDKQAELLTEEELEIKERCSGVRRQLEMLNSLKEMLDRLTKLLPAEKDRYNGLLREARV